jgi:hypothetical protein
MPVVFVHGVNTRDTEPGYDARIRMIAGFVESAWAGLEVGGKPVKSLKPSFPYWGDLATRFAWDMASLPKDGVQALGPGVPEDLRPAVAVLADALAKPSAAQNEPLLSLARQRSLADAVGLLATLMVRSAAKADAADTAAFVVAAGAYAEKNPKPAWLAPLATDEQFLGMLVLEVDQSGGPGGVQALGILGKVMGAVSAAGAAIKNAAKSVAGAALDRVGDFASTKLLAWQRRALNENLGRFFGDVFVYLDDRGDKAKPGQIPGRVLAAFDAARAAAPNEPFVVVAHSLGGVITFDLLSHFRPDIPVDLLVTVGSQVSHFEEIKRFKDSDPAVGAPQRAVTPKNVARWINVLDGVDIFSYACEAVFDRVTDFEYDTKTYVVKAHGAYFEQARFYDRLRTRIEELP